MVSGPKPNSYFYGNFCVPWFYLPPRLQNSEKFRKDLDNLIFTNILNRLIDRSISSFVWGGIPETVSTWTMELLYLFWGNVGMDRADGQYICNGLMPYGKLGVNKNGDPLDGWLYSFDGRNKEVKLWVPGIDNAIVRESSNRGEIVNATYDCVRGRDNSLGIPFFNFIYEKALRLAQRETILDASIESCRQPLIVACTEQDYKGVKRELEQIDDNRTKIIVYNGAFNNDSLSVLDTHIKPEIVQIVRDEIVRMENSIDRMMGINSTPYEKKERLVRDEVNSNNQAVATEIEQRLLWRQKFCEDCNQAFGLNMSVDFRFRSEEISYFDESREGDGYENEAIQSVEARETQLVH